MTIFTISWLNQELAGTFAGIIQQTLQSAADRWSSYIQGHGNINVQLDIGDVGSALATGGPFGYSTNGGRTLVSPIETMRDGVGNGPGIDFTVTVSSNFFKVLFYDPTFSLAVPADKFDAMSIFLHEVGHGLGIVNFSNTTYSSLLSSSGGQSYFNGINAIAAYGGPVPLDSGRSHTSFSDLMKSSISAGTRSDISDVDLGILQDIGAPIATQRKDVISLGPLGDKFFAYGGNDLITGGGGNDSIDGGVGVDTAIFTGTSAQYARKNSGANSIQVSDNVSNRDGIDALVNVERLRFSDKTIALDTDGNSGQVYRLYQAAFDRTPDTPGLTHNVRIVDNGVDLHGMASAFVGSPEFVSRYGATSSDAVFVNALYQNVLHRGADAAGLTNWTNALAASILDRGAVLVGFSESAENKGLVGVSIAAGITLENFA